MAPDPAPGKDPDMCGRYTLTDPGDIVTELHADASGVELAPRYNIAPTQNVPIVRAGKEGGDRKSVV